MCKDNNFEIEVISKKKKNIIKYLLSFFSFSLFFIPFICFGSTVTSSASFFSCVSSSTASSTDCFFGSDFLDIINYNYQFLLFLLGIIIFLLLAKFVKSIFK